MHNPSIKNAVAAVEAARGAMRQAGAYPNPSLIAAMDTVGTGGAGYQGGGIGLVGAIVIIFVVLLLMGRIGPL